MTAGAERNHDWVVQYRRPALATAPERSATGADNKPHAPWHVIRTNDRQYGSFIATDPRALFPYCRWGEGR